MNTTALTDFTQLRPMADRDQACACPYCGGVSQRVILSAPGLATMAAASAAPMLPTSAGSANAPQTVEEYASKRKHQWLQLLRAEQTAGAEQS